MKKMSDDATNGSGPPAAGNAKPARKTWETPAVIVSTLEDTATGANHVSEAGSTQHS